MKALVVDDDRILADLVVFTLRKAGYSAVQAGDTPAALRAFEQEQPDLL
jgi:DNA-binding response OmpR family regulator